MTERYRCAAASRERDEDLAGTASTARRWLAIEQPGPWGADALSQSRMPVRTATALAAFGRQHGLRVVLLRRHGGGEDDGPRTAFVAATHVGGGRGWTVPFDDPAELLELRVEGIDDGDLPGATALTEPVYLACTHGSHDACCAEFGRAAAAALVEAAGDRAWECSHIGGDRFAANVVVLPHGAYHGRVTASMAAALVEHHDAGRLLIETFRGRTRHPFVVQFAEAALRRHLAEDRIDAVRLVTRPRRDGTVRHVPLLADGARFEVAVEVTRADAAQLTCRAAAEHTPPRFRAVSITRV